MNDHLRAQVQDGWIRAYVYIYLKYGAGKSGSTMYVATHTIAYTHTYIHTHTHTHTRSSSPPPLEALDVGGEDGHVVTHVREDVRQGPRRLHDTHTHTVMQ
jgi:hypothetical protein